jgi:hypothetical protein
MTIQDLKDNRNLIIEKIIELGCEENMKEFMELMVEEVKFGFKFDLDYLISTIHNTNFRERAKRSGHKLAEFAGNNDKRTFNHLTKEYQYN